MTELPAEPSSLQQAGASWRTLVRNFGTLAVGEGIARLFGLVAVVVMARALEPHGFGLVTLGATIVIWFSIVVDAGTEVLTLRNVARAPVGLRRIAEPVLGLRLALSVAAAACLVGGAFLLADRGADREVLALFALVLPAIALNLRWMVLGAGAARGVAAGNVASQLVFAAGVVLLVSSEHDSTRVPILQAAGELAFALVLILVLTRRFGIPRPRIDLAAWRATLRQSLPIMASNLGRATMFGFDLVLIALVLGRTEAGYYGAAYKPVLFVLGLLALAGVSFLAAYSAANADRARALLRRTIEAGLLVTVPVAVAVTVGSGLLVELVFGAAYAPAAAALAILVWRLPATAVAMALTNALIAGDRQRSLMWNNVAAAGFNIAANAVVVPVAGISGAAAVSVASEVVVLGLNYRSTNHLRRADPRP